MEKAILDPLPHAASIPTRSIYSIISVARRRAKALLTALQIARMIEVLNRMPENHLNSIGIERNEIPLYARKIILSKNSVL